MKYIELMSEKIERVYYKNLEDTRYSIRKLIKKNDSKGEIDCEISRFGSYFDTLSHDLIIPHIKVCRFLKYNDDKILPILRMLNIYRKKGIHEAFKICFPKDFKIDPKPLNKGLLKQELLTLFSIIRDTYFNSDCLNNTLNSIFKYANDNHISVLDFLEGHYLSFYKININAVNFKLYMKFANDYSLYILNTKVVNYDPLQPMQQDLE